MEFKNFKKQMQQQFEKMSKDVTTLFEVEVDKDVLWNLYLDSFPPGTNEMFRKQREYDCSSCRQFIKNFGNVVTIKDGKVTTIWDFETDCSTFKPVANALSNYIRTNVVTNVYVTKFAKIGVNQNHETTNEGITTWNHLYLELPTRFVDKSSKSEAEIKGEKRDVRNVFKRSLDEISEDTVLTILELIASNTLYKGEEWKSTLNEFIKYKKQYDKLQTSQQKNLFAWEQSLIAGPVIGKIRNHSIGTLLINVSEGMDLDEAVKKYEVIVAPTNYKRPKAIFTQKMLDEAKAKIQELGYMDSLSRRHATIDDITVNNILFSNKDTAKVALDNLDVFGEMAKETSSKPKTFSKVEEITIDNFVNNVLPTAKEVEVYLENKHSNNMVSLIAPEVKDSKTMFKWNNNFSWAYAGNITDSDLTERVKAAGGRVDGVLRFSHSWNHEGMRNASLMDLHVFMPGSTQPKYSTNGKEIHESYGNGERVGWNNRNHYSSGGKQDVDYVNAAPAGYIPVENITFPSMDRLKEGVYTFKIHNWKLRQPTTGGFMAEIAFGGEVYRFTRKQPLAHHEWVTLAKIELKNGQFTILEMAENDTTSIEVWNLKTNNFVPVSTVMFSPNYWDEQKGIGHKHYFFMLKDCINPESPNAFYNEFLKEELMTHKRVFEALGGKMRVKECDNQLSGLGFSSTKRNELIVKVKGNVERVLKIKF